MIRMGVIGCGSIAAGHIGAWTALKDRMQFTGFADVVLERAQKSAANFPGAIAVADYRSMLDVVDAIIIGAEASLRSLRVIWRLYEAEEKGVVADLRGI